ncbi:MAG: TonB-dependent receptor [Bryobacteraceae bacterium]
MNPRLLLISLLLSTSLGFGQTVLATVTGTITDATGAVVANAPVSLLNLENGQSFTAASSNTGNFTVSQLPIGDYDLSVALGGFKTFTHAKFHLSAGQTMREEITLEVGQTTESVTVTAEASLLKTESSELVQNVTLAQLNNLPILIVGATTSGFRDPYVAVRLVPGVRYAGTTAVTTMVVNGTPANTYQTRLDGQTQNSTAPGLVGANMQTQPSVDALEEVAIQTSNFAAEFGTAGGAVINMVSKSGTNQYHGSAYNYGINEALNAAQPYTGLRSKIRQNDWGFTFGGPVRIPKLYNGTSKTFFFWSYEQYRENKIITTGAATVPTAAYRAGNFSNLITQENRLLGTATGPYVDPLGRTTPSGSIFDPLTQRAVGNSQVRDAFVGNTIPTARFDPISMKVLALVPLPTGINSDRGQAGSNYQFPYDQKRVSHIPSIKIDQNLGSKGRLSFYLQETKTSTPRSPQGVDALPIGVSSSLKASASATTARINYDFTASPRLLLHFGLGWNDDDFQTQAVNFGFDPAKELGLQGQTAPGAFPIITSGDSGAALGGMKTLGSGSNSKTWERRPAGNISASYVTGGHTYKIGAEYRIEQFPVFNFSNTTGTYNFGNNWTTQSSLQGVTTNAGFAGFAFSSFMLGGLTGGSQAAPVAARAAKSQTALYMQDNWKVTRKLTLDYGLRWDYGTYAREQYGRYSSFAPGVANPSAAGRLGARQYEFLCKCNFADNYPYAIGPRMGVAYQINAKTVIRGGLGIVYNSTGNASGGLVNTATAGTPGFGQIIGQFRNGIPAGVVPQWPGSDPAAGHVPGTVSAAPPTYLDRNAGRPARLLQWNFTVQRELDRNTVVEVGYVANRGSWWDGGALAPLNVLSEPVLRSYGFNNFTSAAEAALLTTQVGQLSAAQRSTLATRGIALPYSNFPTSQSVRQSLLPFPQYSGAMNPANAPLGKTWYDSLQVTVNKRFSHGLSFNFNYNYSKSLDLMSSPDVFNRQMGKDLGDFDIPHQMRLSAQYEVPRLSNTGLPVISNRFVSYALSGWGVGWYLEYRSTGLVGRPGSTSTTPISQFLGRGPGGAQLKKNADGTDMNPWSVDWVDYDGVRHTDPIDVNCHCFDPTKTVVLNPAAWQNIPDGQWGAQQTSIRNFRGVRFPTESGNFSRNFRIKEKMNLNLRVEFQNVFNRTQFPGISLTNFQNAPTRFTSGANNGLYSGGFGTIVPTSGTTGQRTGSFVARFTF